MVQATTYEKALADRDAVVVLLNAILLKYAGTAVPIEERKEYLVTIRREADFRDGVTCPSTWSCRPFEDTPGAMTRYIVPNGTEVSSDVSPGALERKNAFRARGQIDRNGRSVQDYRSTR